MKLSLSAFVLVCGCATTATVAPPRTLPAPIFTDSLPDAPADVDAEHRMVLPVVSCTGDDGETTGPGVLLSQEMAVHAARLRVSYDELRSLYATDLRTMDRERGVYERQLQLSDEEVRRLHDAAKRTWWERNRGVVGMSGGMVLGAAVVLGVLATTQQVRP